MAFVDFIPYLGFVIGGAFGLPDEAGTLEAMRAFTRSGEFVPDLSVATRPGTTYRVTWTPVPGTTIPDPVPFEQVTLAQPPSASTAEMWVVDPSRSARKASAKPSS